MAESAARRAELRRERLYTWLLLLLFAVAFLLVFKPIRRLSGDALKNAYFTFRFAETIGPGDQAKQQIEQAIKSKLVDDPDIADSRISFPTTTEIKVRVPLGSAGEADAMLGKLKAVVDEAVPEDYGDIVETKADTTEFGDPPLGQFAGFGIYRPRVHLRLGLDLQGGVHLVLQARTQNNQVEFNLGSTAAELKTALDKADAAEEAGEVTPPAAPAEQPAEGEKKAEEGADPAKAEEQPAEADQPAEGEEKPAEEAGKPAEGGEKPADGEEAEDESTTITAEEAELLADEALRERVATRIAKLTQRITESQRERIGEIHGESVGSTIAVFRTFVDNKAADAEQKRGEHARLLLAEVRRVFPKAKMKGEPQNLEIPDNAVEQVRDVIQRRIDRLGVSEAEVATHGTNRVVVQLPGVRDPDEAVAVIGTTARLEFRKVPEAYRPEPVEEDGREVTKFVTATGGEDVPADIVYYEAPEFYSEGRGVDKNVITGNDLKPGSIQVTFDGTQPAVSLALNKDGSDRFDEFARENLSKYLGIFLDREPISAPIMKASRFGGQVQISGGFRDVADANRLKTLLDAGALPVPVDVVEQRTVSATLGADSVRQSSIAGLCGLLLILVVIGAIYRMPGVLANIALFGYVLLVLMALAMLDATLTLPGILGLILSTGMAVDGNVIVFERLKEELRDNPNRPVLQCSNVAYERAFAAISDGNVTCLLSCVVLFWMGVGTIKGFAVTLFIGTLASYFSALVVTRRMQNLFMATRLGQNRKCYRC